MIPKKEVALAVIVLVFLIALLRVCQYNWQYFACKQSMNLAPSPSKSDSSSRFVLIRNARSKSFYCNYARGTESQCVVYASDRGAADFRPLGYAVDIPDKALLFSNDTKYLLVVTDHVATVLDADTLVSERNIDAPSGEAFGTYTSFPLFVPYAQWIGPRTVQLKLFNEDTPEPENSIGMNGTVSQTSPQPMPIRVESFSLTI